MVLRTLVLTFLAALLTAAGYVLLVHGERVDLPAAKTWAATPSTAAASAPRAAASKPPAADREVDAQDAAAASGPPVH